MLLADLGSVHIAKNCDLGLQNASLGLRPQSQFFPIQTSPSANNIYLNINKFLAHQSSHQKITKIYLVIFKEKVKLVPLVGTLLSFTVFGLSRDAFLKKKMLLHYKISQDIQFIPKECEALTRKFPNSTHQR